MTIDWNMLIELLKEFSIDDKAIALIQQTLITTLSGVKFLVEVKTRVRQGNLFSLVQLRLDQNNPRMAEINESAQQCKRNQIRPYKG